MTSSQASDDDIPNVRKPPLVMVIFPSKAYISIVVRVTCLATTTKVCPSIMSKFTRHIGPCFGVPQLKLPRQIVHLVAQPSIHGITFNFHPIKETALPLCNIKLNLPDRDELHVQHANLRQRFATSAVP